MIDNEAAEITYRWFADAHPAAAYATDTERFLAYAVKKTGQCRKDIVKALRETCLEHPDDPEAQMCLAALEETQACPMTR